MRQPASASICPILLKHYHVLFGVTSYVTRCLGPNSWICSWMFLKTEGSCNCTIPSNGVLDFRDRPISGCSLLMCCRRFAVQDLMFQTKALCTHLSQTWLLLSDAFCGVTSLKKFMYVSHDIEDDPLGHPPSPQEESLYIKCARI
jgi:hypothetical protein